MQIKRFKAQDMTAALAQIKKEFGPDAVILSARDIRRRSRMLGVPRISGVEVTAAIDPERLATGSRDAAGVLPADPVPPPLAGEVQDVVRLSASKGLVRSLQTGMNVFRKRGEVMTGKKHPDGGGSPAEGQNLEKRLTACGVTPAVAARVAEQIKRKKTGDAAEIRREAGNGPLARALTALGVSAESQPAVEPSRLTVMVGPTGTGKTTALIKMAAAKIAAGSRVGVITLDQQRIGALAQMRVYADILGFPLEMAADAEELGDALSKLTDCDLIFIDTPGLSPKNAFQIHSLKSTLAAMTARIRTLLVFSATAKDEDLEQALERYRILNPQAMVFTRIDETCRCGNLINLAVSARLPLAYFSDGAQIPDDLQVATADRLADLFAPGETGRSELRPRAQNRTRAQAAAPKKQPGASPGQEPSVQFVANCNSDIFHRPDCKWTRMIKESNMVVFQSVEEARARKFSPCRYCMPVTVEAFRPISQTQQKRSVGGMA